jgi:O-antigen ligase
MTSLPAPGRLPRPAGMTALAALATLAGSGAAAAALAAAMLPRSLGVVFAGLVLGLCAWVAVGDLRPALVGLAAFDLPLQLDRDLGYRTSAGEFGAFGGMNVSITTVAVIGLLLAALVRWSLGERRPALDRGLVAAFGGYVAVAAVSVVWARDRFLAAAWALLLVQNLLLLWVLLRMLRDRRDLERFVGFLLAGLAFESAVIIYQAVTGAGSLAGLRLGGYEATARTAARVGGTVGSPNVAAAYLSIMLPLALALALARVTRLLRMLAGGAFVLGAVALLFGTVSRGGGLALLIGVGLVLVVALRRRWTGGGRLLGLAVPLVLVLVATGGTLLSRVQFDNGAAQGRLPLLSLATAMIRDHPFLGVGANNFVPALPDYLTASYDFAWIYIVHNDYLLVAAELGAAGLALYGYFLFRLVRLGVRAVSRRTDPFLGAVAAGCAGGLAGRLLHMNIDVFNGRPQVQSLVTVVAVLVVADALWTAAREPEPEPRRIPCAA